VPFRLLIAPNVPFRLRRLLTPATRAVGVLCLFASAGFVSGCDRLKAAVGGGGSGAAWVDPWHTDSTLLANSPGLLFRVIEHEKGTAVAPLAKLGKSFGRVVMTDRGWKALDLQYLQEGSTLDAVRDGRVAGAVRMTRGMWTMAGQMDSIPVSNCVVPAGLGQAPSGAHFAVSGYRPKLNPVAPLSEAELSAALSKVPTLIAPSQGIPRSMLGRYQREVHVMNTGVSARPSILVRYNDPEVVPDSVDPTGQRPRQLILILDQGTYGYRPSYTFKTLGNIRDSRRQAYLDYLDVDGDGKAEIFFDVKQVQRGRTFDIVLGLRSEGDGWRPYFLAGVRCIG
jgi:hypothetical protein